MYKTLFLTLKAFVNVMKVFTKCKVNAYHVIQIAQHALNKVTTVYLVREITRWIKIIIAHASKISKYLTKKNVFYVTWIVKINNMLNIA